MVDTQPRSRFQQQVFTYDDYIDSPEALDIEVLTEDALPVLMPFNDEFAMFITVQIKTTGPAGAPVGYVEALMPWRHWCRVVQFELTKAQAEVVDLTARLAETPAETQRRRLIEMRSEPVDPHDHPELIAASMTQAHEALVTTARTQWPRDPMTLTIIATQVALLRAAGSTYQEPNPHAHPAQPPFPGG